MNLYSLAKKPPADTLVTIVVPIYNGDTALFERCFASITDQHHRSLEILIVNDGSTRAFGSWLEEFTKTDLRARVIHQENGGVSAARNAGVSAAKGAYIGFVDGDDYVEPDYVGSALSLAHHTGAEIVFGGIKILREEGSVRWRSGSNPKTSPLVLDADALIEPRTRVLSDSPSDRADSPLTSATNVVGALFAAPLARQVEFPVHVTQAEDRLYNFGALAVARRVAFCSDVWYVYDQTITDSATRAVSNDTGEKLVPTIGAFVAAGLSAEGTSRVPGGTERLRASAATGVANYLKVLVLVASTNLSQHEASRMVRRVLAMDGLADALAHASAGGAGDRLFLWLARRERARSLVLLGRLRARALRS